MSYLLALGQGTSRSRAIVLHATGRVVASSQREFTQHFPQPGWVEHDPAEIWDSQLAAAREALTTAKLPLAGDDCCLGLSDICPPYATDERMPPS
jgi:glycerol kinase